jgi:hypothetical protein
MSENKMSDDRMNESELNKLIDDLPGRIRPQRDLWPEINQRLEHRDARQSAKPTTPVWRMPALAAAVMLALTTGIFIGRGLDAPAAEQMSILEFALAGTVESSEREYQAAFLELVPLDYSGMRIAGDDPESVRGSWDELQKVESSLLTAIREYPTNVFLTEKLMDLRSQQLQFVKQLVLLEQNNWRRT